MIDAFFQRPRTKAGHLLPIPHGNGHILMPWHLPIRAVLFVEQRTAYWKAIFSED